MLEIERHGPLPPVVRGGRAGEHAQRVPTFRWLDPEHVGAEVGEHAGAERAGLEPRQVEDAQM